MSGLGRFNPVFCRKEFLRIEKAGFLVGFVCCNGHAVERAFCIFRGFFVGLKTFFTQLGEF